MNTYYTLNQKEELDDSVRDPPEVVLLKVDQEVTWRMGERSLGILPKVKVKLRTAPGREVDGKLFSATGVGGFSLRTAAGVVLVGANGVDGFVIAVVLANEETACFGAVVLVEVGFCTVDTTGFAVDFGTTGGILGGTGLTGLGGATVASRGLLVTVVGRGVVDTAVIIAEELRVLSNSQKWLERLQDQSSLLSSKPVLFKDEKRKLLGFRVSKSISISSGFESLKPGSLDWMMFTTLPNLSPDGNNKKKTHEGGDDDGGVAADSGSGSVGSVTALAFTGGKESPIPLIGVTWDKGTSLGSHEVSNLRSGTAGKKRPLVRETAKNMHVSTSLS
ncbi:hypothetical protein pdam_00007811 [Pocillopora damicornis]|uniref:Uncharacterized protein n=1 Tax=Pocillopora damicornis TaxID=46731 RepID=A0A3M6TXY3_POCDA|nr:hypothetical protein pdam_00007811 [Pocillopora damicornis]